MTPALVWFRQDLRLHDNPALDAAVARGGAILPVYILDDAAEGRWAPGGASRWWLHQSLAALDRSLRERGSRLWLARGDAETILARLIDATAATAVFWNRRYEPASVARDANLKLRFAAEGIEVKSFKASLLHEPHAIANKQGGPFQVFTPYWRHCLGRDVFAPTKLKAKELPLPANVPTPAPLAELRLEPTTDWAGGIRARWEPGEAGAQRRLRAFVSGAMDGYADARNTPDHDGTSSLSPHLHFGEIGPRQVWAAVRARSRDSGVFPPNRGASTFLNEIGWREFAYHLLYHFPQTPTQPLRGDFARFHWAKDPGGAKLRAWQTGQTGYPLVDAGMRQLWRTGWMHNRVRMVVASFLV
jgi:deoxyribodipyrimidine photo-lyase